MRIGKQPRTRDWAKAGATGTPQHVSPESIVGMLSPDLVSVVLGPQLVELASDRLERYAQDYFLYQESAAAQQQRQQQQQEELSNGDNNESSYETLVEADIAVDGTIKLGQEFEHVLPPQPPEQVEEAPHLPLFHSQFVVNEFEDLVLDQTSRYFFAKPGGSTSSSSGGAPPWKVAAQHAKMDRLLDEQYGMFRPLMDRYPAVGRVIKTVQRNRAAGYYSPFRRGKAPIGKGSAIIILFFLRRGGVSWDKLCFMALYCLVGLQPWALVSIVALGHWLFARRKGRPVGNMPRTIPLVEPYYSTSIGGGGSDDDDDDPNNNDKSQKQEEDVTSKEKQRTRQKKYDILNQPVGDPFNGKDNDATLLDASSKFDTMILGCGPACLFTASLLSRAGRKVLVLSDREDASGCVTLQQQQQQKQQQPVKKDRKTKETKDDDDESSWRSIPFDVDNCNLAKISRQQELLVPALCSSTDTQGGIRFAQIGSASDGYAFMILDIPGVGGGTTAAVADGNEQQQQQQQHNEPFVVCANPRTLMQDAYYYLGDGMPPPPPLPNASTEDASAAAAAGAGDGDNVGESAIGAYLKACRALNASAGHFYISKMLPDSMNQMRNSGPYKECAIRYAGNFLNQYFPLNAQVRSLAAGLGSTWGEDIPPSETSMAAHVTHVSATCGTGEGMHYPVGGPRALCHALANVVRAHGGRILTNVPIKELVFDDDDNDNNSKNKNNKQKQKRPTAPPTPRAGADGGSNQNENDSKDDDGPPPPRCIGVKLADDRKVVLDATKLTAPAVVSMRGMIPTFIMLLPERVRNEYKVPRGLPALATRRPVFKLLLALRGSRAELNLTGADYVRVPAAAAARDYVDPDTGTVQYGIIGAGTGDGGTSTTSTERQPSRPRRRRDQRQHSAATTGEEEGKDEDNDGDESGNADAAAVAVETVNDEEKEAEEDHTASSTSSSRTTTTKQRLRQGRGGGGATTKKFEIGCSWMHISFPSAKDPSFVSRYGNRTTCVVTVQADDDFVQEYDTKPKLFVVKQEAATPTSTTVQRLMERIKKDLFQIYPQIEGNVEHCEIRGPFCDQGLRHNPERYAAKGVHTTSPYPGLFLGGADLTVGDSLSSAMVGGWLAANAVAGYKALDLLFLGKNISTDLEQFLQSPSMMMEDEEGEEDGEDLAVPYDDEPLSVVATTAASTTTADDHDAGPSDENQ